MSYVSLGQVSTNIVLTATQLRNLQTLLRGRGEIGSSPTLAATRQAAVSYGTAMGVPASQIAISGSSISMPPSLLTAIQQPLPEMTFTEAEVYGSASTSAAAKPGGASTSSKSGGGLLPGSSSFAPVASGETPPWVIPVAIGGVAIAGVVAFAVYQGRARPVTANRRKAKATKKKATKKKRRTRAQIDAEYEDALAIVRKLRRQWRAAARQEKTRYDPRTGRRLMKKTKRSWTSPPRPRRSSKAKSLPPPWW
jgi:hypothetical protein